MIKKIFSLISILAVSLFATVNSNAAEKWDMPMAYSATNFHSQNGVMFADAVRIATGGEIDITVHAGGSLFKGGEIKKAIQTGQVPIGERLLSGHQNESLIFGTDSIPFLATSYADSAKLWKHLRPELEKILDKQGLVLLYGVPWPSQGLYFNKEINSVADTKGIKFRSYNNSTARIAELMGMLPVQVEAAELSQALATGVAEAFISSGSTGYDRKVWEHLTHYYKVNAWLPRNYVIINKGIYEGLSGDIRNALHKAADETGAACSAKSAELANWYFEQLEANGMTVTDAGPDFLKELKAIGAKMQSEWLSSVGSEGQAIVDAYNKM